MKNPKTFIAELSQIKQRMNQGEDFSKALKLASKVVNDPEITQQNVKSKFKAVYSFYVWLECIVSYGKAKQAQNGTSAE